MPLPLPTPTPTPIRTSENSITGQQLPVIIPDAVGQLDSKNRCRRHVWSNCLPTIDDIFG